jgi:hypothetical protein
MASTEISSGEEAVDPVHVSALNAEMLPNAIHYGRHEQQCRSDLSSYVGRQRRSRRCHAGT